MALPAHSLEEKEVIQSLTLFWSEKLKPGLDDPSKVIASNSP